ncbi:Uncharacterized protein Rs2_16144 [Raphanus sativus]|nr:Uncharacterized protein Rs2_16144 [Raphanus sativus]
MHPPDLKLMETGNGSSWSSSYSLKGKEIGDQGVPNSYIVVMAGRWIMYDTGSWDFKIYNDLLGRVVDTSGLKDADGLEERILNEFGLLGREIFSDMSYWLNDEDSDMVGKDAAPVQISSVRDYKIFRALARADKSVNLFVTFMELVGGERVFLRSARVIASQEPGAKGIEDADLELLMEVEAFEAAYEEQSGTKKPVNEQSTENLQSAKTAVVASVLIPSSDNLQSSKSAVGGPSEGVVEENVDCKDVDDDETCEDLVVDGGKSKGNDTVAGLGAVDAEKENGKGDDIGEEGDDIGEEGDDDFDYDFNWWHSYVRNDCVSDDDKDDNGGPSVGGRARQHSLNGHSPSVIRGRRGHSSRKLGGRRGGSKSTKQCSKSRCYEEVTDVASDYLCSSRTTTTAYTNDQLGETLVNGTKKSNEKGDGCIEDDVNRACTDETLTGASVNVVLVTPVKQKEKRTHSIEDHDDEEQHPIIRGVRDRCGQTLPNGRANDNNKGDSCMEDDTIPAYTDDRLTGDTLDLVLVTPPQQKEKENKSIEDDDDYDKHPIIPGVKDGG